MLLHKTSICHFYIEKEVRIWNDWFDKMMMRKSSESFVVCPEHIEQRNGTFLPTKYKSITIVTSITQFMLN